tara:strand:- start:330 stop:803 length:474 start_codon:yes stop_codon:yes gene_type:complete
MATGEYTNPWEDTYTNPGFNKYSSGTGFESGNYASRKVNDLYDGRINPDLQMQNMQMPNNPDVGGLSKYLNKDFLGGAGSALQGLGSLASGWAAMKNLKLTRQAMDTQQNQWNTNYEAQRTATNNQIGNQNAWKQAQGRTDYGSYVGGKPSGTTYVG